MTKYVTCSVCGNTISKRKSLSIGDNKRSCRDHQEVKDYIEKQKNEILAKQANEEIEVMSAVSFIRIYHTFKRIPVHILKELVRFKINPYLFKKVDSELRRKGVKMIEDEINETISSAIVINDEIKKYIEPSNKKLTEITIDEMKEKNDKMVKE